MDKNDMFRTKEGLVAAHYLFYVELNKIYRISAADKAYISVPQEPSEAGNLWAPQQFQFKYKVLENEIHSLGIEMIDKPKELAKSDVKDVTQEPQKTDEKIADLGT